MHFLPAFSILFAIAIQPTLCDFLGLTYPAPRDLTSSKSLVRAAWEDVSAVFDAGLRRGKNTSATQDLLGAERVTFSSGLFSLYDDAATELQYHYTAPQIANAKQGTNEVDANSIYRVASVTKLSAVDQHAGSDRRLRVRDSTVYMPRTGLKTQERSKVI